MSVTKWLVEQTKKHNLHRTGQVGDFVAESIAQKKFAASQFVATHGMEAACGQGWQAAMAAHAARQPWRDGFVAESSGEGIDPSAFTAVLGTVMIDRVMTGYKAAMGRVDDLFDTYPTPDNLDEVTITFPSGNTDVPQEVGPGKPYPQTGVGVYTVKVPRPAKYGQTTYVTLEMLKQNRTAEIFRFADSNGEMVGLYRKKRMLQCVLGVTNTYKRNGTAYNTYNVSSPWANKLTDFNQANGPEEFDRFEKLFDGMTHPVTGEQVDIDVSNMQIFVPRSNLIRTRKNVNAQTIYDYNAAVASATRRIETPNPIDGLTEPIADRLARKVLTDSGVSAAVADTYVLYGNFKKAFADREVEPFQVLERDGELSSEMAFRQDIPYACRARVWHVPFTIDPYQVSLGSN